MLKGLMKIEMTDVHTGETETVLEHNMVTNALQEIFKPLGLAKSPSKLLNSFAPYYQILLGGLLLFDTQIEENSSNIFAPQTANLIGCGAYGTQNNTSGTLRGGYNQTESELNMTDRYMKYVYDFATSQSNGTINCVCLTHMSGGYNGYGGKDAVFTGSYILGTQLCDSTLHYVYPDYTGANTGDKYSGYTVGTTELIFLIDRAEDVVYYFRIDSANKITIIKRRAYLKTVSILENPYSKKYFVDEIEIELDTPFISTNYITYNFDNADKCLYIFSSGSSTTVANGNFQVIKITLNTWRTTYYSMANTSGVILSTSGRYAIAHNGYVMLKGNSSPYNLYKFELGNAANVSKFKLTGMSSLAGSPAFAINGRIYYESTSPYLYIASMETNEVLKPECNRIITSTSYQYCYTPVLDEPLLYYFSCGSRYTGGFMMFLNYLATINNLSEPVTKTADKTMKVTYIIQEQ